MSSPGLATTVVLVLVSAIAVAVGGLQPAESGKASGAGWHLAFADEFQGRRLNSRHWVTCYWWDKGGCTNGATNERQWYLPGNVTVSGGALHLVARKQTVRGSDGRWYPYTSGIVTTGRLTHNTQRSPRFAFRYGRVVARIRMPAGRGLWPAFWLLPASQRSRPEIDVVEVRGQHPRRMHAHLHYLAGGEKHDPGHHWTGADTSAGWHNYAIDWSPGSIVWSVDGHVVWRFTKRAAIPHQRMYLLLNLAVGGWPGDPVAATPFPSELDVDYVRVWQKGS